MTIAKSCSFTLWLIPLSCLLFTPAAPSALNQLEKTSLISDIQPQFERLPFPSPKPTTPPLVIPDYIWLSPHELARLPTSGPAWENLKQHADRPLQLPNLSDKNDPTNVLVLAKALVYARTGEPSYRSEVIDACMQIINSENDGDVLSLGRELLAYVISAQLVVLTYPEKLTFSRWLKLVIGKPLKGRTLRTSHQNRPNNWGNHAGASLAAVAVYLKDKGTLNQVARVFRGWLGDRSSYQGFKYKNSDWWQVDPQRPVGINPSGASKNGHNIDGVLPDDQRRSGEFSWPPAKEGYVYEGLQGALALAMILDRAGYPAFGWSDKALLRAFTWLHEQADFPAEGDDTWQPHVINYYYHSDFPAPVPSRAGKNIGWTDWTHQPKKILKAP